MLARDGRMLEILQAKADVEFKEMVGKEEARSAR